MFERLTVCQGREALGESLTAVREVTHGGVSHGAFLRMAKEFVR